MTQAVIFDLFETLVDYDDEKSRAFSAAAADLVGRERAGFHALWREGRRARDTGLMLPYLESIGITGGDAERLLALRRANSAVSRALESSRCWASWDDEVSVAA